MSRIRSDLVPRLWCSVAALMLAAAPAAAQDTAQAPEPGAAPPQVVSTEVNVQNSRASLVVELTDGRVATYSLDNGNVYVDGTDVGDYTRGDELDRSWRSLVASAAEAEPGTVPALLTDWDAPEGAAGAMLDGALEAMFTGVAVQAVGPSQGTPLPPPAIDSIERLESRLAEMQRELERSRARAERDDDWFDDWVASPFRHIVNGIMGLIALLALWAVLVALGMLAVFFARKYIGNIAITARRETLRSMLVGLAGTFLVVPAYVLGIIALAISIVGIPLLLVWAPLFPLAVIAACVIGYMAVAHASGEALVERRLPALARLREGNSYHYVMAGFALLLGLYAIANVAHMAGPWLDFIEAMLMFVAIVITWLALTVGFGAFLLSRAGTRGPLTEETPGDDAAGYAQEEETHV